MDAGLHTAQKNQEETLLRLYDVIGDRRRGIRGYIPMSRGKWYDGISRQIFPAPLKIGSGSYWKLSDIQRLINEAA